MKSFTLEIKKIIASGHGTGTHPELGTILVLGAFPGDVIQVGIYKKLGKLSYGQIISFVEYSLDRDTNPSQAPFFAPNMPWEHLSEFAELRYKKSFVDNLYKHDTDTEQKEIAIVNDNRNIILKQTGYRNKVAYSFMENKGGILSFALYTRGTHGAQKIPQTANILVHPLLEKVGKKFLHFFNQKNISVEALKYLTLRYSYFENRVVAHILVPELNRKKISFKKVDLEKFLNQHSEVKGILVSHSEPDTRSSMTTKDFYSIGDIDSIEMVLNKKYSYHPSLFFQIYPEAFCEILVDVRKNIKDISNHNNLPALDLYAGVGIIGLEIADLVSNVTGVELSPLSHKYAIKNAEQNSVNNFHFIESTVDNILKSITSEQILIVDPTRAGLSKETIAQILKKQPRHIFYISCNPETQHSDFETLKEVYNIKFLKAYNIFPKTHHVESIIVLEKK